MFKTRLIGIKWLFFNIGFFETIKIFLEILCKKPKNHIVIFYFLGKKVRMSIKSEQTDLAMLTEIFCFEAYEIKKEIDPKLIVDGGSNKGSTAIYFGLKYPNAQIHCYEPNIELIPILKENIAINAIKAEVFNEALSDRKGHLFFEVNKNHQYSKLSDKSTNVQVKTISLGDKYNGQKIDILKLDIEGEEEKVVLSIDVNKIEISVIIQEIHYDRINFDNIKNALEKKGYEFESPYSQYKYLNLKESHPILIAIKNKQ
jgi:FkbM family methyltransferase